MVRPGEYLFVGMLDESIIRELLLSSENFMENVFLIESREVGNDIKERLRAKGVKICRKNPLRYLSRELLANRKEEVVVIQSYSKLLLYIAMHPFRGKYYLCKGELEPLDGLKIAKNSAVNIYEKVRRYVSLKAKRKNLKKVRVFPYEIGFPNDYSLIESALRERTFTPKIAVSIVIPVYNRPVELDRSLRGLTYQDYPRDLMEIIVADDGSSEGYENIISQYENVLNVRHVKQDDEGYRLAAVRNLGISESTNEVVILLDCDMIPVPEFVSSHAQWFHVCNNNIVVVGDRGFIDPAGLEPSEIEKEVRSQFARRRAMAPESIRDEDEPYLDWRDRIYKKTDFLRKSLEPYRYASGGNVSFRKAYAVKAGLFDEEFTFWGGEDIEFFYRMYLKGAYIIPENSARAFHQNHPDVAKREEGREKTQNLLERKIPVMRRERRKNGFVPRVSIYMPSYNSKKFISEAIESVILQTYDDWELCICDDGSTDGTYEFLHKEYSKHEKIRIERIPHAGIGGASNRAVRMCRGEFVGQLDSDDVLKPEAVEITVGFLEKHPEFGLVYSNYEIINEKGEFVCAGFSWPDYDPIILLESMIVHHFRMFRSLYWHRTPGFHREIKNAVDYDMYLKLSEVTSFSHLKKVLYCYRIHGDNTSVLDYQLQSENHLRVVREALDRRRLSWEHKVDPTNKRKIVLS
ncbi:MAG: glycosyltransferase [Deltaproteobacteria bacterium]|nr:glycosyltransferase [Deltaproteobacteria bacterium]